MVLEQVIQDLYCQTNNPPGSNFRQRALELLTRAIDFDSAVWATRHSNNHRCRYAEHWSLDDQYATQLSELFSPTPLDTALRKNPNRSIRMSDFCQDKFFFTSRVYNELFKNHGIKRILSIQNIDSPSNLCSFIHLYRNNKENDFSLREKNTLTRLFFHLTAAEPHFHFHHSPDTSSALCTSKGDIFTAQSNFFDQARKAKSSINKLRYELPLKNNSIICAENLTLTISEYGELFKLSFRQNKLLDCLTEREKQITKWVAKGLTFKEVARELSVAPSTVSNHLYKVYKKLNIASRSELAKICQGG